MLVLVGRSDGSSLVERAVAVPVCVSKIFRGGVCAFLLLKCDSEGCSAVFEFCKLLLSEAE